jgi:outer membrane immunogenic protein
MKKLLLGMVGLVALSGSAVAADMAARPYKAAPVVVAPIYDWTGFYIGANGGWGQSRDCWGLVTLGGLTINDGCASRSGGVLGGQIGYRWQTAQFVFGVEAQGDWADIHGSRVSIINPLFNTSTRIDAIGLFTGQIGYAWNNSLFYLKGGAATTRSFIDVTTIATGVNVAAASSTRWGGTIGIGFEYGFSPNWTVGLEYDRLFMGHSNNSFSVVNPLLAGAVNRIGQDVDLLTLRVNYKFGGYGPVVAKY